MGRELDNAGKEIDRVRLEAQAQAGAPAFEQWLNASRNTASAGASPLPPHIRQQLQGFYDNELLNRARFKIGDGGVFNLANLSIQYGGAGAVTLIDVIVCRCRTDFDQCADEMLSTCGGCPSAQLAARCRIAPGHWNVGTLVNSASASTILS